jgi:hypothetical protein
MIEIFGPNTVRVVQLIAQVLELSPADMDRVATAWRQVPAEERAAAWTALHHAKSPDNRDAIRNAAAVARQQAMTAARSRERQDWAFWSAAADAAGAVAADGRQADDRSYRLLVAAMATTLGWLLPAAPGSADSALRDTSLAAKDRG